MRIDKSFTYTIIESLARGLASASRVSVPAVGEHREAESIVWPTGFEIKINASVLDGGEKNTTHPNMLISDNDGSRRARQVSLTTQSIKQSIGSTASLRLASQCG